MLRNCEEKLERIVRLFGPWIRLTMSLQHARQSSSLRGWRETAFLPCRDDPNVPHSSTLFSYLSVRSPHSWKRLMPRTIGLWKKKEARGFCITLLLQIDDRSRDDVYSPSTLARPLDTLSLFRVPRLTLVCVPISNWRNKATQDRSWSYDARQGSRPWPK